MSSAARERWVLFFAYHFPPDSAIGGARPYRFYRYLPEHGFQCHVITEADVALRPKLNAQHVADPFSQEGVRGLGWQFERLVRKVLLPGWIALQWSQHAFRTACGFVEKHPNCEITIFSTSPPVGVHLAAWRLQRKYRLPWVVDFRDPLSGNPGDAQAAWQTHLTYAFLERAFVRASAVAIANTDVAQRMLQARLPAEAGKIKLLWNGFDPQNRLVAMPIPERSFRVFSHVGELYLGRTAAPIVESVARLIARGSLPPHGIRIQLTGPANEACLPSPELARTAEAAGWLQLNPTQVPKTEADRITRESDGLLIIQPQSAIQVPAKLFEYLQLGRPILAFVPRSSSIEGVLSQSGVPFRVVYSDSSPEQFDASLLEYLSLPPHQAAPSAWFEQTFNAQRQADLLAHWLDDAHRAR